MTIIISYQDTVSIVAIVSVECIAVKGKIQMMWWCRRWRRDGTGRDGGGADIVPACCIVRFAVSDKLTPDTQLTNKHGRSLSWAGRCRWLLCLCWTLFCCRWTELIKWFYIWYLPKASNRKKSFEVQESLNSWSVELLNHLISDKNTGILWGFMLPCVE